MQRRKIFALLVGFVLAFASLSVAPAHSTAAGSSSSASSPAPNAYTKKFVSGAYGFGSLVTGGKLPLRSDQTAEAVMGCRSFVTRSRVNDEASVRLPGLGTATGMKTRLWTARNGRVLSSYARHDTASIKLLDTLVGSLSIQALSTQVRAYWTGTRFKAQAYSKIAGLRLTPIVGPAINLRLPTPSKPVVVPGIATIWLGKSVTNVQSNEAYVARTGLVIKVHATGTTFQLGHAVTRLGKRAVMGVFSGKASAVRGSLVAKTVGIGATPNTPLPCQGTGGETRTRSIAGVDLGVLKVDALSTNMRAWQSGKTRRAITRGNVAKVTLGSALEISAIYGRADVTRRGTTLKRVATSSIGTIKVNGQVVSLPNGKSLTIPGIAKVQRRVVTRLSKGVDVTAIRITLLNGTGAVIDLGNATARTL